MYLVTTILYLVTTSRSAPSCSRSTAADNRDTHTHTLLRVPVAVGGAIHSLPKSPPLALPPIWVSVGSESFCPAFGAVCIQIWIFSRLGANEECVQGRDPNL